MNVKILEKGSLLALGVTPTSWTLLRAVHQNGNHLKNYEVLRRGEN